MKTPMGAAFLACISATTVGWAGPSLNPVLDETFNARLGAFFVNADGTIRSTREGESRDDIDLDRLGIDDDYTSALFGARWRFSERWRLTFNYFGFDNNGEVSRTFFDLDFGDLELNGFATLESSLKTDFYVGQVGYSFFRNERAELGVGLGLHVIDFETELKASAAVNDISTTIGSAKSDVTAPLPDIRVFGTYALTPRWSLDGHLAYFTLDYDRYSGNLVGGGVNLEYRFTDHFGLGVGYNYVNMDLRIDRNEGSDRYDLQYKGPMVFLSAGF